MTSNFKRYGISGPKNPERTVHVDSSTAKPAKYLVGGEGPLSVRSGAMIHQMRQGLKKAIRYMRGDLKQEEFARKIGISQSALARMESLSNNVFPSTPLLIRMALISGRDLRMSFVKRAESEFGADAISAETTGFSSSSGLAEGGALREDYSFGGHVLEAVSTEPQAEKQSNEG